MSLDQMTDDQLDAHIRRLLPAPPRGRGWEHPHRERLLQFIATGETAHRQSVAGSPVAVVRVGSRRRGATGRRRWRLATVAAAVAALLLGVAAIERSRDDSAPAEQPVAPSVPAVPVPTVSVPSSAVMPLPTGPDRPDRFPIVTEDWPSAGSASGAWGGMISWQSWSAAEALVARPDGDSLRDAVSLTVRSEVIDSRTVGAPQIVTVAGVDLEVSVEAGSPLITSVVLSGTPTVVASGLDPLGFVQAAGGMPVTDARIDENGETTFAIGDLPAGYEVVVPPTRLPQGAVEATTWAPDGDAGEGMIVSIGVHSPLISLAQAGDLQRVDIQGTTGWLRESERGATVVWQVSETTWALVAGGSNADDAVGFARSLEFVDEEAWTQRYSVEQPVYPARDVVLAAAATSTSVASTPDPVVARSARDTAPADVPVACGEDPPLDEPIDGARTAPSPDAALASFLATDRAQILYPFGYVQVAIGDTGAYRYERRNERGDLVTIVDVTPSGNEWQATRLQVSPC